jgi:Zn-finger nucleic acid-binding protein
VDNVIKLELKFCERCGGLWLRSEGSNEVYCKQCAPDMQDIAVPRKKTPVPVQAAVQAGGVLCG